MRSKGIAYLIDYNYKENSYSDEGLKEIKETKIYCNHFSSSLNNKLEASREGLRLEGRFEMYAFEYSDQPDVKIDGEIYTILSVDRKSEDKVVITYGERLSNE